MSTRPTDSHALDSNHMQIAQAKPGIDVMMEITLDGIPGHTNALVWACHKLSRNSGWWTDPKTGEDIDPNPTFPTKLCLIHSEISEAMEGHRKGLKDDHLPHRDMAEVELADAVIRICDLAGAMGYDLGSAMAEKLAYNQQRADHKLVNRASDNGKKY
jgi:hypothetical protein